MDNQAFTIKPSFFDDPVSIDNKLWKKKAPLKKPSEIQIIEGILFKKSSRTGFWKSRYYVLFEDRIAYFKNAREKDAEAYCLPHNMRVEKFMLEGDKEEKFGIRLIHNREYCEMFARSQDIQEKWITALTRFCVLTCYASCFVNIKAIGKGSFARVFLAKKKKDNTDLAVKTFDKNLLNSVEKAKPSLINEINVMRKLEHENIIKLFEVYESDNHVYLVLELLHGGELFDRIVKKGQYSEKDASILMRNLLSALSFMHSKGLMHRDLKPENLILKDNENDWDVKIADFGLATTITGELLFKRCGTPGYVAPEILADEKYDEKVDVFSAGVILYILLSGGSPFHGNSYNEILWKNKVGDVNYNFEEYGQKVSAPAIDLMKKMLHKDPKQRISAAEALEHQWIATGGVFRSPRTMAPIYLSSAQENMKRFQEDRFNVKNIKPKDLDAAALERSGHAPSPLINGRVISVATPSQFQSPDVRKAGQMSGKFMGMVSPAGRGSASTGDSNGEHSVLSEEINFVNVNLGGYNPNKTLLSMLNETSNKSSVQNTPVIPKKTVDVKAKAKKALNVQETLLKYLGMPSGAAPPKAGDGAK